MRTATACDRRAERTWAQTSNASLQRRRGLRAVGALFGALAVLVGGCADSSGEKQTESGTATLESAPCPKADPPGGSEADLGPEFSCGFLVVSENRDRPEGRTIKVAVARAKAQSPAPGPDPLVYLTGGPGGSGLLLGNELVALGLNRDRDLIVVDQRGTQNAQPALRSPGGRRVQQQQPWGYRYRRRTTGEQTWPQCGPAATGWPARGSTWPPSTPPTRGHRGSAHRARD